MLELTEKNYKSSIITTLMEIKENKFYQMNKQKLISKVQKQKESDANSRIEN